MFLKVTNGFKNSSSGATDLTKERGVERGHLMRCRYAPSLLASGILAHTARSLAHARNWAISSARVTDSGTVEESAVSRSSVLKSCLPAVGETGQAPSLLKAAYRAVCTADSISAPEKPWAAAAT